MKLVISNKAYSPWPMRVWLLMKYTGMAFDELVVDLSTTDKVTRLKAVSPSGRVPVLLDGDVQVWDSMAIIEYLGERFPEARLWPAETAARAHARSISNELHSGFAALRGRLIMNTRREPKAVEMTPQVQADIARIGELLETTLTTFGGPQGFLYDAFSAADAVYAPIASRFYSYEIPVPPTVGSYFNQIRALPAYRQWCEEALADPWRNETTDNL
jgi:glutathione S-transferase